MYYYLGSPIRNSLRFVEGVFCKVFSRLFLSIPGSLLEIPYHFMRDSQILGSS